MYGNSADIGVIAEHSDFIFQDARVPAARRFLLIIVGNDGNGVTRAIVGAVHERLSRRSCCAAMGIDKLTENSRFCGGLG